MASNLKYELGVGCLMLGAIAVAGFMALQIGAFAAFGSRVDVSVPLEDAAGLSVGAAVSVAGVDVGSVTSLGVKHDLAIAALALDPDAELRQGSRAVVRARSLLGEKYIEILPGAADAALLVDGDTLPRVGPQLEIDEMVNAMGPLIAALDAESVRSAVDGLAAALAEDPDRLKRMLENADRALISGADAAEALPPLLADAKQAIARADRALAVVEARGTEAKALIARADALLSDLEKAGEPLPETAERLKRVVADAESLMTTLKGSQDDLEAVIDMAASIDEEWVVGLLRDEGVRIRFFNRKVKDK